jgi:hypothetical protein
MQQDPQDRPTAGELLKDPWLLASRRTLNASWRKAAGLVRKGLKPHDAHEKISSVVQRMLKANLGEVSERLPAQVPQQSFGAQGRPLRHAPEEDGSIRSVDKRGSVGVGGARDDTARNVSGKDFQLSMDDLAEVRECRMCVPIRLTNLL